MAPPARSAGGTVTGSRCASGDVKGSPIHDSRNFCPGVDTIELPLSHPVCDNGRMMNRVSLLGQPMAVPVRGGAARSDRKFGRRAVWLLSASSRIFPDIPTCFFAASAPDQYLQVVENQRSDFLAVHVQGQRELPRFCPLTLLNPKLMVCL